MSTYELVDPTAYQRLLVTPEDGGEATPPRHEPSTTEFLEALHNPRYVQFGSLTLAAYSLFHGTRARLDESLPPVVIVPPVDRYNGAASRRGCQLLSGLAVHLDRRIIAIDLPATGNSSRPSLAHCLRIPLDTTAEMVNHAVDSIGFKNEAIDFMGICLGGVIAAQAAIQRGDQARSLLTFATPGFEPDLFYRLVEQRRRNTPESQLDKACDDRANLQAERDDNLAADYLDIDDLPPIHVHKTRRLLMHLKLGSQLLGESSRMLTVPEELSKDTLWHDFVGDSDILTSWQNHDRVTSRRNPLKTQQTVLEGVGHDWAMIRAPYTARLAKLALSAT
jgi:pimeloyl-ACP methyl ester carboxylesterase